MSVIWQRLIEDNGKKIELVTVVRTGVIRVSIKNVSIKLAE